MNIDIVELSSDKIKDAGKANQAFGIIGELMPFFSDGKWTADEKLYNKPYEKRYSDDEIDLNDYIKRSDKAIYLAYSEGECVGRIRLSKHWNKYCFIEDIAVAKKYRGKGVGGRLIKIAGKWAEKNGLFGLMLETQNTNLLACRFYFKQGFVLGAVDTELYSGFGNSEYGLFFYKKI